MNALHLTAEGASAVGRGQAAVRAAEAVLWTGIDPEHTRHFGELLEQHLSAVRKDGD